MPDKYFNMKKRGYGIAFAIVIAFIIYLIGAKTGHNIPAFKPESMIELENQVAYYDSTYLRLQGGTKLYTPPGGLVEEGGYLNFDLRTWDGGKAWYVVNYDMEDGRLEIIGLADTIYPGLVAQQAGLDRLFEYVSENGSITLDGENIEEQIKILREAGISVTTDEGIETMSDAEYRAYQDSINSTLEYEEGEFIEDGEYVEPDFENEP